MGVERVRKRCEGTERDSVGDRSSVMAESVFHHLFCIFGAKGKVIYYSMSMIRFKFFGCW